jgi:hypothetical protein
MESAYPNMAVDVYPFTEAAPGEIAAVDEYDPTYLTALAAGNLFASPQRISSVEDLTAGGFGTLTSQDAVGQNVHGKGVWSDGRWRVVFDRALESGEADDMTFELGQVASIAFAAWDGSSGERNGQKATSNWYSFQLEGQAPAPPAQWAPPGAQELAQMLVLVAGVGLAIWIMAAVIDRMGRSRGV